MKQPLTKFLKWSEAVGILITAMAVLLKLVVSSIASPLFLVGLSLLAITYFVLPYTGSPPPNNENKFGVADLLVTILGKVMHIGISVLCIAYLFTILHLKGANEMMIIGLLTLVICLIISMVLILGNRERMRLLSAPLFRSIFAMMFYLITPFLS